MGRKVLLEGGVGEIVEKKSRFIATVFKIEDYEEATLYIEEMKKKYWDARHNCYAFVLGENNEVQRYSDDGEPQGTAGKPILDILLSENITNCLVVVTRYFGGTLLGTGGLIRAYQQSTKEGLSNSCIIEQILGIQYTIELDYNLVGKLNYLAQTSNYHIVNSVYGENVLVDIIINKEAKGEFEKQITQMTSGKERIEVVKDVVFGIDKGKIMIL